MVRNTNVKQNGNLQNFYWQHWLVSYPCNRTWMPIGLWDVKDPTLSRQSAYGWWQGCQPYAPAARYSRETLLVFCFWYLLLLEAEWTPRPSATRRIRSLSLSLSLSLAMKLSTTQEATLQFASILYNPKVQYRIHKSSPPVPNWARPIQSTSPYPTSSRSILILSTHLRVGLPSGIFPSNNVYAFLFSPIRAMCPTHLIFLDLIILIILGEEYKLRNSSLCSSLRFPITSCLLGPNVVLRVLKQTSVCVPPSMSETKFHTHTEPKAKLYPCIF
jgi:hypothetical protein